jgi:protein ImuA
MLFDPPAALSAWALLQHGLDSRHWLVVRARSGQGRAAAAGAAPGHGHPRGANRLAPLLPSADLLWALEQSLKSGHVGAILAWLPLSLRADALRRLQIAAQAHDGPVFIFRDVQARSKPSPAPLRLLLQPAGVDGLSLRLLKRRGPPLAQPLRLVLPSPLTPRQQAQAQARDITRQAALGQARRVEQAGFLPRLRPG